MRQVHTFQEHLWVPFLLHWFLSEQEVSLINDFKFNIILLLSRIELCSWMGTSWTATSSNAWLSYRASGSLSSCTSSSCSFSGNVLILRTESSCDFLSEEPISNIAKTSMISVILKSLQGLYDYWPLFRVCCIKLTRVFSEKLPNSLVTLRLCWVGTGRTVVGVCYSCWFCLLELWDETITFGEDVDFFGRPRVLFTYTWL